MTFSKGKILCIDDDKDTCELVKMMFELEGFQVTTCFSASEGIKKAREDDIRLIILDNHLEDMSGVQACREIRDFNHQVPIIFYSGEARREEIEKALTAGADSYLVKPLGFDDLTCVVKDLLQDSD